MRGEGVASKSSRIGKGRGPVAAVLCDARKEKNGFF